MFENRFKFELQNLFIKPTPRLDRDLLRVGGRLSHSSVNYDTKHPWIIPTGSELTSLIILDTHERTLHGGAQLTLATLRREYWIHKGRAMVRAAINKCDDCWRYSNQFNGQLMGDLPQARVTPAYPFEHSGVNFAGPCNV